MVFFDRNLDDSLEIRLMPSSFAMALFTVMADNLVSAEIVSMAGQQQPDLSACLTKQVKTNLSAVSNRPPVGDQIAHTRSSGLVPPVTALGGVPSRYLLGMPGLLVISTSPSPSRDLIDLFADTTDSPVASASSEADGHDTPSEPENLTRANRTAESR
jgi:hypothetical protein